ncbi:MULTISPECIES: peptidoglycan recognition family protein [unclassified Corynebacterium]|uniref:peptidoglycan recognition protein family protein n=1 Tax=unclassified Corynebacterium TaxID=2624378 RepID=UPI0029CA6B7E|nr:MULTISPECIES: peptidoglycan recognition family protein [unclassified Corynebacterium]WPF65911.1 peptidoglycan recognition family protein [Corynebacterium sp. 22KM0430]WPF68404.1 peptidoglycan recognition family protein [Corynebacterium sp. 21KM1197]
MKNTLSRRQLGRAALATGTLLAAAHLPLPARAVAPGATALSLRFPGTTLTPDAPPATLRFHSHEGTISRLVYPSTHCRDGEFPLCSELITLPENTTQIEASPEVGTHFHRLIPSNLALPDAPEATVTEGLRVVSRRQWGADETLMTWTPEYAAPVCITVHHTEIPTGREPEYQHNWPAAVRGVYRFHALTENGGRGWGDIGYHLLIDPEGTVYQGRTTGAPGRAVFSGTPAPDSPAPHSPVGGVVTAGHVFKANTGNIGVCLIGNFTRDHPTTAAYRSLITVLSALCQACSFHPLNQVRYVNPSAGVDATQPIISGHKDWQEVTGIPKDCPGRNLWYQLPEIRQHIADTLRTA